MFKSMIYKEWLKTGTAIMCLVMMMAGFTAYDFLALAKNASLHGYDFLWSYAVGKYSILVDNLIYLPVICGLALAAAQFIPETFRKCLKLTLHLPMPQFRTVSVMQGYGIGVLLVLFIVQGASLGIFLGHYLVADIVWRILFSLITWYCAGLCAYIWAGAIMLEPAWRMRIFETVLMLALLSTFFLSSQMMGYSRGILPLATVTTLAAFPLIHYSVRRFKDGVQ